MEIYDRRTVGPRSGLIDPKLLLTTAVAANIGLAAPLSVLAQDAAGAGADGGKGGKGGRGR
jgi:hypothetical protein